MMHGKTLGQREGISENARNLAVWEGVSKRVTAQAISDEIALERLVISLFEALVHF